MSEQLPHLRRTHIETIAQGIIDALKQGGLSSKYKIEAFPDNPSQFDMSNLEKVALVQYTGSRYDAPNETGSGAQLRRAEYAIHLYLRQVGTAVRGAREIEQVRLALQGLQLDGTELFVTRDGLVDQDDALWRYVVEVACVIPAIPLNRLHPSPFVSDFNKAEGA
jgi:hypothetical protein